MPVVEVVLPAVRRAVAATRNGRVGVIGTVATITSGAYEDAFAAAPRHRGHRGGLPAVRRVRRARDDQRAAAAGAGRVLPRAARTPPASTPWCSAARTTRCSPGCCRWCMGETVTLVSSAEETAKDVYRVLLPADLLRPDDAPPPRHVFRGHRARRAVRAARAAGSSVRDCVGRVARGVRRSRDEADRAGLLGQRARPGLAGVGLPARGRGLPAGPRHRATAPSARCSATSTRPTSTRSSSRTCTPTTAST